MATRSLYSVPKLENYSPENLDRAREDAANAIATEARQVSTEAEWKAFRDRWLARKHGIITQLNDLWLKAAPVEAKREVGQRLNWLRKHIEGIVESARNQVRFLEMKTVDVVGTEVSVPAKDLEDLARGIELQREAIDITLPGIRHPLGAKHPVLRTMDEIVSVFKSMGYSVATGPEIETDYYNFESLNFPPNHPARDTQDTIFIAGQESEPQRERLLLRTHTSPVQIRVMEQQKPPIRVVIPGKVHRNDAPDATHSPMFHQVEGLAVDTNITFADLKGSLDHAMKMLFGSAVRTRFRPSFFPFTEPSAEVLISCIFCGGKGCRVCKMSGWIELLGSGMVDPALYGFVDYDPAKVSGFAFGMGADRIALMKYGVEDIQLFFNGDVRFLQQFA